MSENLSSAEIWVTSDAKLAVTVPLSERDSQSERSLRERLFRAVTHRFTHGDPDVVHLYLQATQTDPLQIIEDDPVLRPMPTYGVVLSRVEVGA